MKEVAIYKPKYKFLQNIFWVAKVMKKSGGLVSTVLGIIPTLIMSLANVVLIRMVVDFVSNGAELKFLFLFVGVYMAVSMVCLSLNSVAEVQVGTKYANNIRKDFVMMIYEKVLHADYAALESLEQREIINRGIMIIGNSGRGICMIYSYFRKALTNIFGITAVGVLLSVANPFLIIICLLSGAVTIATVYFNNGLASKKDHITDDLWREHQYFTLGAPAEPQSGKDIRIYNMESFFKKTIDILFADYRRVLLSFFKKENYLVALNTAVMLIRDGLVFYVLIRLCLDGKFTAGDFAFYFSAIRIFVSWVSQTESDFMNFILIHHQVDQFRIFLEIPDEE